MQDQNAPVSGPGHDPLINALHGAVAGELRHVRVLIEQLAEALV